MPSSERLERLAVILTITTVGLMADNILLCLENADNNGSQLPKEDQERLKQARDLLDRIRASQLPDSITSPIAEEEFRLIREALREFEKDLPWSFPGDRTIIILLGQMAGELKCMAEYGLRPTERTKEVCLMISDYTTERLKELSPLV